MTVATFQSNILETEYNGWANYETWNVALWIQNDYGFYSIALNCDDYQEFQDAVEGMILDTPDGVSFTDDSLNHIELPQMIQDLWL